MCNMEEVTYVLGNGNWKRVGHIHNHDNVPLPKVVDEEQKLWNRAVAVFGD